MTPCTRALPPQEGLALGNVGSSIAKEIFGVAGLTIENGLGGPLTAICCYDFMFGHKAP